MYQPLRALTTFSRSDDRKLALAVALGKGGLKDLQVDFSLYQTGTGLRTELLSMPLRLVSAMTNKPMPPAGRFPKEMRRQNRTVYLLKNRSTLFVDNSRLIANTLQTKSMVQCGRGRDTDLLLFD